MSQVVDVAFPLRGGPLPLDHGFVLFSALARVCPAIHAEDGWGVHPVFGVRDGSRLDLEVRSRIKVRLPVSMISEVMGLAGATIEVAGQPVSLGFPQVFPLIPAGHLRARLVTIRGFEQEPEFVDALRRQIDQLELGQDSASVEVTLGRRRVMGIHGKKVVGFAVGLTGLLVDGSLRVQERGLGGRRHMGAGMFVPPGRG